MQSCFRQLALSSASKSGLTFLRMQSRGESFEIYWPDPMIGRQAEAPTEFGLSPIVTIGVMRRELCIEAEHPPLSLTVTLCRGPLRPREDSILGYL